MANPITSLRGSRCSRVNAWHCCLVGFGFQEFHETLSSTKVARERLARFTGPGPGPDCTVGARSAPSRPDRGPTESGPVSCTKLASPSFAIDTVVIRMLRKTGVELHQGTIGPACTVGPRSGLDCTVGPPRLHRRAPIGPRLRRRAPVRASLRCHS